MSLKCLASSNLDYRELEKFFGELEMASLQRRIKKMMPDEQQVGEGQMSMF